MKCGYPTDIQSLRQYKLEFESKNLAPVLSEEVKTKIINETSLNLAVRYRHYLDSLIARKEAAADRFYEVSDHHLLHYLEKNFYAKNKLLETDPNICTQSIYDLLLKSKDKDRVDNHSLSINDLRLQYLSQDSYWLYKKNQRAHLEAINKIKNDPDKVEF